jgi:hypothetical protein
MKGNSSTSFKKRQELCLCIKKRRINLLQPTKNRKNTREQDHAPKTETCNRNKTTYNNQRGATAKGRLYESLRLRL